MKKALSLFLAILMIFSVFSVGTFAEGTPLTVSATVNNKALANSSVSVGSTIALLFSGDVIDPDNAALFTANQAMIKVTDSQDAAVSNITIQKGTQNTTILVTLGSSLAKGAYTLKLDKDLKDKTNATLGTDVAIPFNITVTDPNSLSQQQAYLKKNNLMSAKDMTFVFYIDRGTYFEAQSVFDTASSSFVKKSPEEMKDIDPFVKFPTTAGFQEPGATVMLPFVTAPKGWNFTGWYCVEDATPYAAGYGFVIPSAYKNQKDAQGNPLPTDGGVYTFKAMYNPAEAEEDTFAKVFEILSKIFGTIIGLIAYQGDTAAGIAFVRKVFGGIAS